VPALDPADLGLVDAGEVSELLLREAAFATAFGKLAREREVEPECFELGGGLRAIGRSFGFQLVHEVRERGHSAICVLSHIESKCARRADLRCDRDSSDRMAELEQIAYDSGLRALDKQEKVLEELRARTGILLAASSLAASLLGGQALDDLHPVAVAVAALVAFVLSLSASLYVLMPRQGFVFALKGPAVYEELFAFRDDPDELHRRLAYDLQRFWDNNDDLLGPVRRAFRIAALSLVVEVIALAVLASDTL
jgi:hypothetical protein